MALGLWLVALACGRDLEPVAGGLWLVANGGHGLWPLPWLLAVALACGRSHGLWPMADGLWPMAMACGSYTTKLTFVGLWLLGQETNILSNTFDARWVGEFTPK